MKVEYTKKTIKDLEKITSKIREKIIKKIKLYSKLDNPIASAKTLRDYSIGEYRFRIDDYRVVFDVKNDTIIVLRIGHRRDIYK